MYYYGHSNPSKQNKSTPKKETNCEAPLIELLGIKLYSDDILVLLLIYFLYIEKNNDLLLYILLFSLILI